MQILSGEFKNRKILPPKGLLTRPTSGKMRETFFNMCRDLVEEAVFLDLFAGSGAIGLEALSRGASHAFFVDQSAESVRCIKENIKQLGVEKRATVIHADVFTALKRLEKNKTQFDLIYADPPYEHKEELGLQVILALDHSPLLKKSAWVFLEESSNVEFSTENLQQLLLHSYRKNGRSSLHEFKLKALCQA